MIENQKPVLFDLDSLHSFCMKEKLQPYKEKQIAYEIFKNQNIFWDDMTTISKDLRHNLTENFDILSLTVDKIKEDNQTTKFSFLTSDWVVLETVLMYHYRKVKDNSDSKLDTKKLNRITICISSQVGCPVGCEFCVTWKLWLMRNLTWDEIFSQVLYSNWYIKKKFGKKEDWTLYKIRNVVFMGMWEPLLNYDNMKKLFPYFLEQNRLSLSKRHITISTCGIIPGIQRLIDDDVKVKLAVSLHAPNQQLREKLIPIAKAYPLDSLMDILDKYILATDNRIFYEYIMIDWVNDTEELAYQLIDLLRWKLAHVNLIPYNENPAIDFLESKKSQILKFKSILEYGWITVTVRDAMWREVKSACGQLWYEKVKQKCS